MAFRVNRLLIAVLVLLVGIGPLGRVMAVQHICAPDAEQAIVAEGMKHGDHAHHKDMGQTDVKSQSIQGCDSCDKGCCQGGLCSMGHCVGTAAAFQTSTALAFEHSAVSSAMLTVDRPLAGRLTPPFRPPQV